MPVTCSRQGGRLADRSRITSAQDLLPAYRPQKAMLVHQEICVFERGEQDVLILPVAVGACVDPLFVFKDDVNIRPQHLKFEIFKEIVGSILGPYANTVAWAWTGGGIDCGQDFHRAISNQDIEHRGRDSCESLKLWFSCSWEWIGLAHVWTYRIHGAVKLYNFMAVWNM